MENFRTEEEILNGVTESYGRVGTQCSMIVGAFRRGVNWSDNHPRKGFVDINKAVRRPARAGPKYPTGVMTQSSGVGHFLIFC